MSGVTAATVTAAAAVASTAFGAYSVLSNKAKSPMLPTPKLPAPPAPVSRNDTGSQIVVGADNVKNQRIGNGSNPVRTNGASAADVLGGLGAGGINI